MSIEADKGKKVIEIGKAISATALGLFITELEGDLDAQQAAWAQAEADVAAWFERKRAQA